MKVLLVAVALLNCARWGVAETATESGSLVRSMPPVIVTATNTLAEDQSIGPNNQPEWTARRRFAITRIYVQPPWQVDTELSWHASYDRGEAPINQLTQEIELGLPHRLQLDYEAAEGNYFNETQRADYWRYASSSVELRWALADWGKILFNPTVKGEWKFNNALADFYELSLSVGDELAQRWHWGAELFYEQQVGDDREREYAGSVALSYTVIDEKLGVGIESKLKDEGDKDQHNPELSLIVGPSIQWRPTARTHLDVAPLFGVTGRAAHVETFIFFGFDFGPGSERSETLSPVSLRNE
jgi:hypothetical protein